MSWGIDEEKVNTRRLEEERDRLKQAIKSLISSGPRYRPGRLHRGFYSQEEDLFGEPFGRNFAETFEGITDEEERQEAIDRAVRSLMAKRWKRPDAEKRVMASILKYRERMGY